MKPKPLKVAVLADVLPPEGHTGVGNAHYHLWRALLERDLDVKAYTFDEPAWRREAGDAELKLGLPQVLTLAVKAAARGLLWVLARFRHPLQGPGQRLEWDVALRGAFNGLRLVEPLRSFGPDLIVVPDRGAVAAFWPKDLQWRLVVVAHSNPLRFLDQPLIGLRDPLDARLALALEQRMLAAAAGAVAPSRYMLEVFGRSYRFGGKAVAIPNLLDEAVLDAVKPHPMPGGKERRWICIPAAGNQNKGRAYVPALVAALARRHGAKIGFFLSGELSPAFRREVGAGLGQAALHAPGPLPYEQNIARLKACALCLSPTLIENFGMALLEAQFCAVPVLTFDVGGNREVVDHGRSGAVVPYLDVKALAEAASALLEQPARRARWAKAARSRARRAFSGAKAGQAYERFLRSLVRPGASAGRA